MADKIFELELEGVKESSGCLAGQLWRSRLGLENGDIISEWPYKANSQNHECLTVLSLYVRI